MSQGSSQNGKAAVVSSDDFGQALYDGNVEEVRRLLQSDSFLVNQPARAYGYGLPLWYALRHHRHEIVELVQVLLDHDADVNAKVDCGSAALHVAVERNILEVVELLLHSHADVNIRDSRGQTPLSLTTWVEMARLLISHGADVNIIDNKGHPVWLSAIARCDLETFKVLTEYVVDQDLHATWGEEGLSAIHQAAGGHDLEILEYLLDQGFDVNARTANGRTPLHCAVSNNDTSPSRVQLLLQRGADASAIDHDVETVFSRLYGDLSDATEVTKLLIDHGADITKDGERLLVQALRATKAIPRSLFAQFIIEQEKIDLNTSSSVDIEALNIDPSVYRDTWLFRLHDTLAFRMLDMLIENRCAFSDDYGLILMSLIKHGADINARQRQTGKTLLHFAVVCQKYNMRDFIPEVQLLLEKGSDVHAADSKGWTPILLAARDFKWKIVEILVNHGADVNSIARDDAGNPLWALLSFACESPFWATLSSACEIDEVRMVQLLLNAGAQVDYRDRDGNTALMICVRKGRVECAQLLLNAGAQVDYRNKDGDTALLICARNGQVECANLLLGNGSDVDAADNKGWAPLLIAIKESNKWTMNNTMFLDRRADANIALEEDDTPLSWAWERDRVRMVQLLLDAGALVDYRDKDGVTALLICGFVGCATLLLARGADIHAGNRNGYTPFLRACRKGKLDMIYCLIRLSSHHRRLEMLIPVSYPRASTGAGDDSVDDGIDYDIDLDLDFDIDDSDDDIDDPDAVPGANFDIDDSDDDIDDPDAVPGANGDNKVNHQECDIFGDSDSDDVGDNNVNHECDIFDDSISHDDDAGGGATGSWFSSRCIFDESDRG